MFYLVPPSVFYIHILPLCNQEYQNNIYRTHFNNLVLSLRGLRAMYYVDNIHFPSYRSDLDKAITQLDVYLLDLETAIK